MRISIRYMKKNKKGYIQVYTGDGKGKTTAAIGLSIRAAGAGLKVFIGQFIKMGDYSEIKSLKRFSDCITVEQFGLGRFYRGTPPPEDISAARKGLHRIREVMDSGAYDLIVLEEVNVAVTCGLFTVEELLEFLDHKPETLELVLTGRGADPRVIEKADLVTEMKAVKHYYFEGVKARIGIEK